MAMAKILEETALLIPVGMKMAVEGIDTPNEVLVGHAVSHGLDPIVGCVIPHVGQEEVEQPVPIKIEKYGAGRMALIAQAR